MIFKPIPVSQCKELIKNEKDALIEEHKEVQKYFNTLSCIRCGEVVFPILNSKQPFKPGVLTPNVLAKCGKCFVEFEPYTKIEVVPPKTPEDLI